jgi:hypothetical protein
VVFILEFEGDCLPHFGQINIFVGCLLPNFYLKLFENPIL